MTISDTSEPLAITKRHSCIDGFWFERGSQDHLAYLLTMILHELRAIKRSPLRTDTGQ